MGNSTPAQPSRHALVARRLRHSAIALFAASALTACGANFNASTNLPYQPGEGISVREGGVFALNTLIVTDGEGNGTIVARLVNQQDEEDAVEAIGAVDSEGTEIPAAPLATPLQLGAVGEADQSVQAGTEGVLRISGDNLVAGSFVTLTFTFTNAAPLEVQAPVVTVGTVYTEIPVGPIETPTDDETTG